MIFVSYARKDWDKVKELIDLLKNNFGNDVFFLDSKDIEIGRLDFLSKINEALEKSDIFIAYITENFLKSSIWQIEMNAYFLSTLNSEHKTIIPFYPKNIIKEAPLIYKGINSLVEENLAEIIKVIWKIKNGDLITELKSPLVNNFNITLKLTYINKIIFNFLYYNRHFVNPKLTLFLNPKINWTEHFGSYFSIWNHLEIIWEPFKKVSSNHKEENNASFSFLGVYFAGWKDKIEIAILKKDCDFKFWLRLFKPIITEHKDGIVFKENIFDIIKIEDYKGIIGEFKLNDQ